MKVVQGAVEHFSIATILGFGLFVFAFYTIFTTEIPSSNETGEKKSSPEVGSIEIDTAQGTIIINFARWQRRTSTIADFQNDTLVYTPGNSTPGILPDTIELEDSNLGIDTGNDLKVRTQADIAKDTIVLSQLGESLEFSPSSNLDSHFSIIVLLMALFFLLYFSYRMYLLKPPKLESNKIIYEDTPELIGLFKKFTTEIFELQTPRRIKRFQNKLRFQFDHLNSKSSFNLAETELYFQVLLLCEMYKDDIELFNDNYITLDGIHFLIFEVKAMSFGDSIHKVDLPGSGVHEVREEMLKVFEIFDELNGEIAI